MTKSELEAERDRLARIFYESSGRSHGLAWNGYITGFDAAVKVMLERDRMLREAAMAICKHDGFDCVGDEFGALLDQLAEALAQLPEIAKGILG